jgi:hypothetical protein
MFIYDSTSIAFSRKAEEMAREIIASLGIPVRRQRFLFKNYLYPIHVVIFEGSELGHFNAPFLQLGLNRKLVYLAKDSVLRDILKHEIAHYLCYLHYGEVATSHGREFKETCQRYGFSSEVAAATIDLEAANLSKEGDLDSERVIEKVKKLLQLAQSSNVHEAELATMKANELLLRHNLNRVSSDDGPIYLERVINQKRKDTKQMAIFDILRHFVVKPVLSSGKNICCIEISGSYTNVRLAQYVAEFLDRELDHLWQKARQEHGFSGLVAKNSFFLGVAKGFEEKMKRSKMGFSESDQKALIVVEKQLEENTRLIYRRLSTTSSSGSVDSGARAAGIEEGKTLSIRKGVEGGTKKLLLIGG